MPIVAGERLRLGEKVIEKDGKVFRARTLKPEEMERILDMRVDAEEGDVLEVNYQSGHVLRGTAAHKASDR